MSDHNGENWPYHENRNTGEMVACAANPCKIHGGSDIMASSLEDAYKQKADGSGASVEGMIASHATNDDDARAERRKEIISTPELDDPTGGYDGGSAFIGGRYHDSKNTDNKVVARFIRRDIKALKDNDDIPAGWRVGVHMQKGVGMNGYDITVKYDEDDPSASPYRPATYDDVHTSMSVRDAFFRAGQEHGNELTKDQFDDYIKKNNIRVMKEDAARSLDWVMQAANQYGRSDVNAMIDYYSSSRKSSFSGFIRE